MKKSILTKIILYSLSLFCISCNTKKEVQHEAQISIQIENVPSTLDIAENIQSKSFVLLNDTVPEALYKNIDKCIVRGNRIYILDYFGTGSVKVFDMNGNFLFSVGERGNGADNYFKVTDFDVTVDGIYLLDPRQRKILSYNLENQIKKVHSYNNRLQGINGICVTSDNNFLLAMDANAGVSEQIVLADQDFHIKSTILCYDENSTKGHLNIGDFKRCGKQIIYHHPISDDIYVFNEKGEIARSYQVALSDNEIPKDLIRDYALVSKAKRNGEKLSYFHETPFMCGDLLLSTITYQSNKAFLGLDISNRELALKEYKMDNLSFSLSAPNFPVYADENIIVCPLDRMVYDYLDNDSKKELDEATLSFLDEGSKLLVIYHLKKSLI